MRSDMGKCIIERPRAGSHHRNAKVRHFGKFVKDKDGNIEYEGFTRIPVSFRAYGYNHKEFTDVLGPLRRYLQASCGRPWNDVYSEIARTLGHSGYAIHHIIEAHLDVETCTFRGEDGQVWYCKDGVWPITHSYKWVQFYVEPETGILRSIDPRRWRQWRQRQKPKPPLMRIAISDGKDYRKINGVWFYVEFHTVEVRHPYTLRGTVHYKTETQEVVDCKRQLNKKQLRDLGLKR